VRTAAAVEMSGSGAPSRTTRPTPTRARSTRLVGRSTPALAMESIMGAGRITISGFSPPESFCWMTAGLATVNSTRCPLSRANCTATTLSTAAGAPELKTRRSAAAALPARHRERATQRARLALRRAALVSVLIRSFLNDVEAGKARQR
jgi:hypothetical protein